MNNNIKTGIGFLIPAGALVGFVLSIIAGNYLLGTLLAVTGILGWFIYMAVMETAPPTVTGNVIILFGFLLSLAVFLNYGWEQNMFGGFMFRTDGSILALIILLFSILLGVVYRRYDLSGGKTEPPLNEKELALVKKALAGEETSEKGVSEPKIIVVKQEAPKEPEPEPEEYEYDYNAAYAYPPEYYYDDEEDYDEDEYEDEGE